MLVGPGGVVATGGRFVASALDIGNDAFMQGGPLTLSGGGDGMVINLGKIGSSGGDVFLVSRTAAVNGGSISAPQGTAELAAGNQVLLQDASGGQQVFVQAGSGGTAMNGGTIQAAQISLQAADGNVYALAGNSTAIRATGTATRDGHVWLVADQGARARERRDRRDATPTAAAARSRRAANTLDVAGANVQARTWKLGAPTFTVDQANADALARSLSNGTSVDVEASGGDLTVGGNVQWNGNASLTLGAAHGVSIGPGATIGNTGNGNLTLRADAGGIDNGGSVTNRGTIDWSKSGGIVSALYDMNGSYAPGTLLTNSGWTAAPYSGLVTQITAYKLVNTLADLSGVVEGSRGQLCARQGHRRERAPPIRTSSRRSAQRRRRSPASSTASATRSTSSRRWRIVNDDRYGMFGVIGASGVVRNLNLTNASTGDYSSGAFGLLAGQNNGLVTYVNTTGGVGQNGFGGAGAGGLVGVNNGTIERSSSTADVGYQIPAGGLVGVNNGTIAQSFATGATQAGHARRNRRARRVQQRTHHAVVCDGQRGRLRRRRTRVRQRHQRRDQRIVRGGASRRRRASGRSGRRHRGVQPGRDPQQRLLEQGHDDSHRARPDRIRAPSPPDSNGLTTAQMSNASNYLDWNIPAGGVWAMPAGATHPVLQWQQAQP